MDLKIYDLTNPILLVEIDVKSDYKTRRAAVLKLLSNTYTLVRIFLQIND